MIRQSAYYRLLRQLIDTPPGLLWRKVGRHLKQSVQHTWARLETRLGRAGLSNRAFCRSVTTPDFLAHMRTRRQHHFFIGPAARTEVVATLRAICPQTADAIIAAADQSCDHIFDLLGSGPVHLGASIDWHVDFKTGHRWDPTAFYLDLTSAPFPGGYDIKVPWELSRGQHLVWLGQAYWLTADEKYAQEFVGQITDWIEHNPPRRGVNWVCTMDVAIRAVNWLWSYHFFTESSSLTDKFRLAFFKSLLIHGRHIFNNLEYSETLTNNHYLSNIVGLVYLGLLLPEFKEAEKWRTFGLVELEREMVKQVYPDGVDFEASTAYHRLVTEMFLSTTLLAQLNGHNFSSAYRQRLERMLEFILHLTKPDGTVPLLGDNDNGRLHRLQVWNDSPREWRDFRYLLAVAAPLFDRLDFAQAAGDQWADAIWFWGAQANTWQNQAAAVQLEPHRSAAFPDAGVYILRSDDFYVAVDAGQNGQNNNGGHAHNDVLSFELSALGYNWIIDPGTYVYTADYSLRNQFRATAAHNTVIVDGQEQNRFDKHLLFKMPADAAPRVLTWDSNPAYDLLIAEHYGYNRLPKPVTHRRTFYLDKQNRFCWLQDELLGVGRHQFEGIFRLAGAVQIDPWQTGFIWRQDTSALLLVSCPFRRKIAPDMETFRDWAAPGYGAKTAQSVIRALVTGPAPVVLDWLICPVRAQAQPYPSPDQIQQWQNRVEHILARVEATQPQ
ncbi:MAG: alginate lyase family protein [Anaerolineae bacterium]|nr:alginate lyase family protein [Anaerolineae bacterium]